MASVMILLEDGTDGPACASVPKYSEMALLAETHGPSALTPAQRYAMAALIAVHKASKDADADGGKIIVSLPPIRG